MLTKREILLKRSILRVYMRVHYTTAKFHASIVQSAFHYWKKQNSCFSQYFLPTFPCPFSNLFSFLTRTSGPEVTQNSRATMFKSWTRWTRVERNLPVIECNKLPNRAIIPKKITKSVGLQPKVFGVVPFSWSICCGGTHVGRLS